MDNEENKLVVDEDYVVVSCVYLVLEAGKEKNTLNEIVNYVLE